MNYTPFFSIIVPIYKTEKYIHQCVESILSQSFTNFEVILVDDGSPDLCPQICDNYVCKDSRIKVVHKENGGLVSARKAGLAQSVGEYIINVDSDDYIAVNHLDNIYNIINKHHSQVVMFGFNQFDENTIIPVKTLLPEGIYDGGKLEIIKENIILGKDLSTVIYNCVWSMAIKKDIYIKYQNAVPNEIRRGEDLAVTAPLLANVETVYISDFCGYYYRNNPTSIMNVFKKDEMGRVKILISFLSGKLSEIYFERINAYLLLEYYRYLSSAISVYSYKEYKELISDTLDSDLIYRLKNAYCGKTTHISNKIVFAIFKRRLFKFFWILMKTKRKLTN